MILQHRSLGKSDAKSCEENSLKLISLKIVLNGRSLCMNIGRSLWYRPRAPGGTIKQYDGTREDETRRAGLTPPASVGGTDAPARSDPITRRVPHSGASAPA
jgi:hypothetical protein